MGEVVGEPVRLPGTEQRFSRNGHFGIVQRKMARRLFERDLANVRRIDRNPAKSAEEYLGATMLRLADHLGVRAEALVTEFGRRDSDAIHVACGQADCTRQPDVERIQVRAFTSEVAGLEHRGDVADAAAARLWIAERVLDDPLVDAPRLFEIAER